MKKVLASILALCMVFGTAITAAADDAAADSINNDVVYEVVTVDVEDLMVEIAQRPAMYAATGNFYGNKLTGNAKTIYNDMLSYFENIDNGIGDCISKYTVKGTFADVQAALEANLMDHTELLNWFGKGPGNNISYVSGGGNVYTISRLLRTIASPVRNRRIHIVSAMGQNLIPTGRSMPIRTMTAPPRLQKPPRLWPMPAAVTMRRSVISTKPSVT